jgi:hypothetical protein
MHCTARKHIILRTDRDSAAKVARKANLKMA